MKLDSQILVFFLRLFFQNLRLSQIFILTSYAKPLTLFVFTAFYTISFAILYRNSDSHSLTDEISCLVATSEMSSVPFLDWCEHFIPTVEFSGQDHAMMKSNIKEKKFDDSEDDGLVVDKDILSNHDLAGVHSLCGYEGDDEDNGDYEDEDFNKRIDEFIAAKKREWKEEMIKERLLYIEEAML